MSSGNVCGPCSPGKRAPISPPPSDSDNEELLAKKKEMGYSKVWKPSTRLSPVKRSFHSHEPSFDTHYPSEGMLNEGRGKFAKRIWTTQYCDTCGQQIENPPALPSHISDKVIQEILTRKQTTENSLAWCIE